MKNQQNANRSQSVMEHLSDITDQEWGGRFDPSIKSPVYPHELTRFDELSQNIGSLLAWLEASGEEITLTIRPGEVTLAGPEGPITRLKSCRLLCAALVAFPEPLVLSPSA